MRILSKIKQGGCRPVFTKQLSLDNLALTSITMNYLPKSNGKDNCLISRLVLCISCKNVKMSLRSFGTTQSNKYARKHKRSLRGAWGACPPPNVGAPAL